MLALSRLRLWVLATAVLATPACSDDSPATGGSGGSGAAVSNGGTAGSGLGGASTGTGFTDPTFVSIEISPPSATITVDNGVIPPPSQFTVLGTTDKNEQIAIDPSEITWSFARPDLAQLSPSGALTATGLVGGQSVLTASYKTLQATADVTVKLVLSSDPGAVDPTIKDLLENATTPDGALSLLYPYDKTVFPRGLAGPVIQWNGGNAGDIYRIHAESPTFEFTAWTAVPPPSRFSFPTTPDVWKVLTDSNTGDIQVSIRRYDGTTAYVGPTQTWKIAAANLAGTIYYWEVNTGNVVRIKPGATAPEYFLQKPANVTCVACHSVSADGSTLVAAFHGGYSPWGTFNAADGSNIYATDSASGFEAISPNGSHVLWGQSSGSNSLTLSTSTNLTGLAFLTPPAGWPTHPAWSTDGKKVALGVRMDGNWLDFVNSSLYVADVDVTVPSITNTKPIVMSDPGLPTTTFPTWSPDSAHIAFQRSNQARTRGALGEIWLTSPDGTNVIAMSNLNGAGYLLNEQARATYEPTFLPIAVGGYFWIVVVSERMYGNTLTDTNLASRRKQLWVAAIDANPQPGQDPSHPAFWLPGQGLDNQNMRGAWALDPCKQLGEDCNAGYECCDGFCLYDDQQGKYTCSESQGCSPNGSACTQASDCCDLTADCINGFCASVTAG
ncbi:MAG: hypothetical protein U0271_16605 [Polyangiaceae bacterium]